MKFMKNAKFFAGFYEKMIRFDLKKPKKMRIYL